MQKQIRFSTSSRYVCLEGLSEVGSYSTATGMTLDYAGKEICDRDYQFGPFTRQMYVIHIITDGKGIYKTPTGEYELEKGDAFIIYPGVETTYRADHKKPWTYMWVGFHGERVEVILNKIGFTMDRPVIHLEDIEPFRISIDNILIHSKLTISDELKRMSSFMEYLAQWIDYTNTQNVDTSVDEFTQDYPSDVYVDAVKDYMLVHFSDKIRINDIASRIGIDRSYLTSSFKKKMGISPQEYLINLRMDKACDLLSNTTESISAIANDCGYPDFGAFSKAFKQKIGLSPKDFRDTPVEVEFTYEKVNGIKYPL